MFWIDWTLKRRNDYISQTFYLNDKCEINNQSFEHVPNSVLNNSLNIRSPVLHSFKNRDADKLSVSIDLNQYMFNFPGNNSKRKSNQKLYPQVSIQN